MATSVRNLVSGAISFRHEIHMGSIFRLADLFRDIDTRFAYPRYDVQVELT